MPYFKTKYIYNKSEIALKKFLIFLIFCYLYLQTYAQSIIGTWEGDLGGTEFLQINIIQVNTNICGYSWDYMYTNKADYCKAYFNGNYVAASKTIFFNGYSFMQNTGGHVLIQLKATLTKINGKTVLKGYCRTAPSMLMPGGYPTEVLLYKTSNVPTIITQPMKDCVIEYKAEQKRLLELKRNTISPKKIIPKITNPIIKPIIKKSVVPKTKTLPAKPFIKKDTAIKLQIPSYKKDSILKPIVTFAPPQIINGRKNKEQSRIVLNDKNITLELYDNGTVDGDAVSIFYNGKKIVDNKKLSTTAIKINLQLDEFSTTHSIVMYAENLGSIPPNTALIIVTTPSKKRYELYSSATLQQNAELIFEYKAK